MTIERLSVSNVRNLRSVELELTGRFNLIYGKNGSGKTSFLEAIHLLGLGRSFRQWRGQHLISFQQDTLSVFADIDKEQTIGIEKQRAGRTTIRINGQNHQSTMELARQLPLLLINPDGYLLLESGPKYRRQFLDWGLFHVEPQFYPLWKRLHQTLRQRNQALRHHLPKQQIEVWDVTLAKDAEEIHGMRNRYLQQYLPVLEQILLHLVDFKSIFEYRRGWPEDKPLEQALCDSLIQDRQQGYTSFGPHRADVRVMTTQQLGKDVLSRGQLKLLFCAMKLAQGQLLYQLREKHCIYLIDDLAAELDQENRELMRKILTGLNAQVFVTGIDLDFLRGFCRESEALLFHVEQGNMTIPFEDL